MQNLLNNTGEQDGFPLIPLDLSDTSPATEQSGEIFFYSTVISNNLSFPKDLMVCLIYQESPT